MPLNGICIEFGKIILSVIQNLSFLIFPENQNFHLFPDTFFMLTSLGRFVFEIGGKSVSIQITVQCLFHRFTN
jgi:hypothetical protein